MLTLILATMQNDARALEVFHDTNSTYIYKIFLTHHLLLLPTPSYLLFDPVLSLSFISLNHRRKEQE
jgi:hypothetical protein